MSMSVIISWDDLLMERRLPAGDIIKLTTTLDNGLGSRVGFRLVTAPRVTWYKQIRFFDNGGTRAWLETRDQAHVAGPTNLDVDLFNRGLLRVELVKAMAFGTPTGVYELTNLGRWKGNLLTFEWLED
jgi:hypothetical protein